MRRVWILAALVAGCEDENREFQSGDAAVSGDALPDAAADGTAGDSTLPDAALPDAGLEGPLGVELLPRLAGLWSGPALETPLGQFPILNMDIRAVEGQVFSRFDLNAENNLRFAFAVEDVEGEPKVVYRNGGFFVGIERDTRTVLVERTEDTYRFCHNTRGCEYLDATFSFDGDDGLTLVVRVREQMHLRWPARRLEERDVPEDFYPESGPHDAPFAPLPALVVQASWREPLEAPRTVWMLLSDTPCGFTGACNPSRVLSIEAPAGATEATLRLEQVHPADYHLNVFLDRNGNFGARLFPDRGDGIAGLDYRLTVAPEGTTEVARALSITVP